MSSIFLIGNDSIDDLRHQWQSVSDPRSMWQALVDEADRYNFARVDLDPKYAFDEERLCIYMHRLWK